MHEYNILIQILNAKKSNNLIQDITWKAIYTGFPRSKMWQLISCKLIGTVRQPSVGRNLCCCGFRKSRVDKYELLFRRSLKLSVGNLSGFSLLVTSFRYGNDYQVFFQAYVIWSILITGLNMRCIIHSFSSSKPP